jgi:acetolactate synthase-1/2/3 large subunit
MSVNQQLPSRAARTGAADLLIGLKKNGIDYLFANSGTDFPPIIEALASFPAEQLPTPITVPHETASVGMAHGYYLVTGRPQATMVHVNVGLANSIMGIINAGSDNIPVVVLSGRTPITEHARLGSRMTPIQYGQEMYSQASLVGDLVKFHYEMRYPEQGEILATRAVTLAKSEPMGPTYLSLPREALSDTIDDKNGAIDIAQSASVGPAADTDALATAAKWLAAAQNPLILCQRSDVHGRMARELSRLAEIHAIPVVEPFPLRNVMASDHPMFLGYDTKKVLPEADVILVIDSPVPWIEASYRPGPEKKIIHVGPDPMFGRLPVRSYQIDLAIVAEPASALATLISLMPPPGAAVESRRRGIEVTARRRRESDIDLALSGATSPMSAEWVSHCLSAIMDDRAVVFSDLGVVPSAMTVRGPNRFFITPHSGGLGWALPAALGAQLADRDRLCIACVGDGSYMFANPVACHQIAEALQLPLLVIVKNNGIWNAVRRSVITGYPHGAAIRSNDIPLTSLEPSPDYTMIARASRAHAERIDNGKDLQTALERALDIIRTERRLVLLELNVAISDKH